MELAKPAAANIHVLEATLGSPPFYTRRNSYEEHIEATVRNAGLLALLVDRMARIVSVIERSGQLATICDPAQRYPEASPYH